VSFHLRTARFAYEQYIYTNYYNKIAPGINFEFRKKNATSPYTHKLGYRYVAINKEFTNYSVSDSGIVTTFKDNFSYGVHDISYQFTRNDALWPLAARLNVQAGVDVQKVSLTLNQKLYVNATKYFEVRAFAGKMLYMRGSGNNLVDYRFRMSGWNGSNDYLYDYSFVGRSETWGLAANQFAEADGAFKAYSYLGQTSEWLAAVNIKSPRVFKLPFLFYADIGTCAEDGFAPGMDRLMYDGGIDIVLGRDVCEIFVPFFMSKNLQDFNTLNKIDFVHQIRFTFNLHRMNPFMLLKQAVSF
jgi:hypothetical protein